MAPLSTWVNSPDFLATPTMLQGRGLGGGLGFDSSRDSFKSVFDLDVVSKVAARRPIIELELCLIFSGAATPPPSTSSEVFFASENVLDDSGLKSVVGDVRLLALPVELIIHKAKVSKNTLKQNKVH